MSGGEPSSIKQMRLVCKRLPALNNVIRLPGIPAFYGIKEEKPMSEHTTLYRKWRPIDFSSVVGQDHITSVLKYQIANGRSSHAYLFCGSRGTGKTTCAKILAKAVNCLSPVDGNPCGKCEACRLIESGADTDIIEMDAASNNGVDYIRDIREEVIYTPAALKKRVYIIDEVHMLSSGAFNALLKTLEEPPQHVVFILATTELQKLPATVTSRCQRFDFKRISTDDIASRLEYIAAKENISVTHEAAKLIGRISQGGMRDAISLLELCSGKGKSINIALVNETAGVMGRGLSSDTISAILKKDIQKLFEIIGDITSASADLSIFFGELIEFYRDMLVIKSTKNAKAYLDLTDEEYRSTEELAEHFNKEKLLYHIKTLSEAYSSMQRSATVKRITAEMALVTLTDDRISVTPEALLSRIASLEEKLASGSFKPTNTGEKKQPSPYKEQPAVKPEKKNADSSLSPLSSWAEIIETVERSDNFAAEMLKKSKGYSDGTRIVIKTSNSFSPTILGRNEVKALIATGINLVGDLTDITPDSIEVEYCKECTNDDDPLDAF